MKKTAEKLILGNIITLEDDLPFASAMTVVDGRIQYIGDAETAKGFCSDATEIKDYGEGYIFPGFLEAHAHGMGAGKRALGGATLESGNSYEDYQKLFKAYVDRTPGKAFYFGSGWSLKEGFPTKKLLDDVCPDTPAAIQSIDGHSMIVNTKCMEVFDIDGDYAKACQPGEVETDEEGNPTGLLHETPAMGILGKIPESIEDLKAGILYWQNFAFSKGYTAATEAGTNLVSPLQNQAYKELAEEGKLKLRTYAYYSVNDNTDTPEADAEEAFHFAQANDSEYFRTVGLKVFIDGVIEAHTAWMLDGYNDMPDYHGVQRFNDKEKMVRLIKAASKYNMGVHTHSIGDGSTKFVLDCIEEAQKEIRGTDQRNVICHLQIVDEKDYQRFADTETTALVFPLFAPKLPGYFPQEVDYVGEEKAEHSYPIHSFLKAGVRTAFHTDYPVSQNVDIPLSIFTACERYSLKYGKESLRNPEERISQKDALLGLTKNVAYMWHQEDNLGSLAVGKIANACIYDVDLLGEKIEKVANAKLLFTLVDGEEVYKAE
ncbi:MAG: amidohydrolase [Lachnospiraceae bacterium]|nr:amidohydrolase [Lachnospiraceae bacterium]